MKILLRWFILSLAVFITGFAVAGVFVENIWIAILVGAILLFIYMIIKPIVKILTLPLTLITFGLFGFVLNALFFLFVSKLIGGFDVSGFMPALWGSIIVSIMNWLSDKILD